MSRYHRQIILPEIGLEGQAKLSKAKVLVIGAGGLGCPVLSYLTGAGVGTIGIIDNDTISETNLHRQVLYQTAQIGNFKAETAVLNLQKLNPEIEFETYTDWLTVDNALDIITKYDIIVDASDNFATRYLVNDSCVILNKPFVFAAIQGFEAQVSVFNYKSGPTYRCLFPEPPTDAPDCNTLGVLGVLPSIAGSFQANEVLKIILEIGDVLSGKLLIYNTLQNSFLTLNFVKNKDNTPITKLQSSYNFSCEIPSDNISLEKLLKLKNQNKNLTIIDLREKNEVKLFDIEDAIQIPFTLLPFQLNKIDKNNTLVLFCATGTRSSEAKVFLEEQGFGRVVLLKQE